MDERFLTIRSAAEVVRRGVAHAPASAAWDMPSLPEPRVHRIHAYPAKFPAFLTTNALEYARREGIRPKRVADIFCGCGTVAFEARRAGLEFWGCDVNPVAALIARTKSGDYQPKWLRAYCHKVLAAMPQCSVEPPDLHPQAIARLREWFAPAQFDELAQLLNAIYQTVPRRSSYRDVLLCAFSAILKACSQWRQRSIKPAHDPKKTPANVAETFRLRCETMAQAYAEAGALKNTQLDIHLADVLVVKAPAKPVDLILTSPPYVTSYEYADLHQLSSLWLGYAKDYRTLRKGSIGSAQHDLNFNRSFTRLNRVGTRVVFSLYNEDPHAARAVANYYLDMQAVAKRCREFLAPTGAAIFVIGNTEYHGVEIDNASHLAESLFQAGFRRVRVTKRQISNKTATPYRTESGRFSREATDTQIYAHEFVVIAHP